MSLTANELYDALRQGQLLAPADLAAIRSGWFQDKRADVADVRMFGRWLILNNYLTEFALRLLGNGKAPWLRLNQYIVVSPIVKGPQAGAYLGLDPLRRKVVIEFLAARYAADPSALQAFETVSRLALTVQHPNVNHVLDAGQAHGRHYLVKEYDEGETLADILARRGKIAPTPAARLFALALAGLQALHDKGVPAGELGPDCLLLTAGGQGGRAGAAKARTLKILHSGVPRRLFDPAALDNSAGPEAPAVSGDDWAMSRPQNELLLLGATFYQTLTGQRPQAPAEPVRQLAPDVPEMLAEEVEQLIATNPSGRPRSAGHAAKTLRVFLASEEESREVRAEEQVGHPAREHSSAPQPEEEETPTTPVKPAEGVRGKLSELWKEIQPRERDLLFLGGGAIAVIVAVLLLTLLTGIHFVNIVCLAAGGALSFFVERLLRVREEASGDGD